MKRKRDQLVVVGQKAKVFCRIKVKSVKLEGSNLGSSIWAPLASIEADFEKHIVKR